MIEPTLSDATTVREVVAWSIGIISTVALGILAFLKRKSRLGLDVARDADEIAMIKAKNARIAHLELEVERTYSERNASMRELGALTTRVELLTEMGRLAQIEAAAAALERRKLTDLLLENTRLTKEGIKVAEHAYHEANTVNEKIAILSQHNLDVGELSKRTALETNNLQSAHLDSIDAVGRDTNERVKDTNERVKTIERGPLKPANG